MSLLTKLLDEAGDPAHRDLEAEATAAIDTGAPEAENLRALQGYFMDDEERRTLALEVDGQPAGVLTREMLLDLTGDLERGAAVADHMILPGDPATSFRRLRCMGAGCAREWVVAGGGAGGRPRCPDHPEAGLEPVA